MEGNVINTVISPWHTHSSFWWEILNLNRMFTGKLLKLPLIFIGPDWLIFWYYRKSLQRVCDARMKCVHLFTAVPFVMIVNGEKSFWASEHHVTSNSRCSYHAEIAPQPGIFPVCLVCTVLKDKVKGTLWNINCNKQNKQNQPHWWIESVVDGRLLAKFSN